MTVPTPSAPARLRHIILPTVLLLAVLVLVAPVAGQTPEPGLGSQSMRPFRFVFIAYALAWILIGGWVLSVGRRLARLERRLGD